MPKYFERLLDRACINKYNSGEKTKLYEMQ